MADLVYLLIKLQSAVRKSSYFITKGNLVEQILNDDMLAPTGQKSEYDRRYHIKLAGVP